MEHLTPSDECRCGGQGFPPCPAGSVHGTWIPRWMLVNPPANVDSRTRRCLEEALRIEAALAPEKIPYLTLPDEYVRMEEEWHDPERRGALLHRLAQMTPASLSTLIPSDFLSDVDFIRLWAVRLKGYLDLLHDISYYDLLPAQPETEDLDDFFTDRF